MNDDFLHRLRREPPPGFLAELKDKLDRQSAAPPRPRRLSFSRGLIVGLLLATTAFAVTSLSINSAPKSLHALLAAPVELVARMSSGPSQSKDRQHHGPAPLGPAWLPTHVAPHPEGDALGAESSGVELGHGGCPLSGLGGGKVTLDTDGRPRHPRTRRLMSLPQRAPTRTPRPSPTASARTLGSLGCRPIGTEPRFQQSVQPQTPRAVPPLRSCIAA